MKGLIGAAVVLLVAVALAAIGTYASFVDTEVSPDNSYQAGSLDLQLADFDEDFGHDPLSDSVTRTWDHRLLYPAGMEPGDFLESAVYFKNIGTLAGDSLDITAVLINSEPTNDTDGENDAENALVQPGVDNDLDGAVDEDPIDGLDNDGDHLLDEDASSGTIPPIANRGIYDKDRWMIINYMKYLNSPPAIDIVWNNGLSWNPTYMDDEDGDGRITLNDLERHPVRGLPPPVSGLSNLSMKVTFDSAAGNEYQGDEVMMTLIFALGTN